MQVFKAYFKVMRGCAMPLVINLSVFVGLAVLFASVAPDALPDGFDPVKSPVAVINRDGDGEIAQGLVDYLSQVCRLVQYPDDVDKLQDALFHRMVEYIAIIPEGFSNAFMSGEECAIQKVIVPNSTSSHYVDMSINKFLNTVNLYRQYVKPVSPAGLIAAVIDDLSVDVPVTLETGRGMSEDDRPGHSYYYRYCAYGLLAMVTMGISSIMMAFNRPDLLLRNWASPLPRRSISVQLALGHGVFALGCWAILMLLGLVLHGRALISSGVAGLYALNTLVFAAVCTAIGFVVGNSVKSTGAQAGAVNIIALGMSFLGGVFVPQSAMSKQVLAVGKFLPSYWFVRANDAISGISVFTLERLSPILSSILIQLGFAVAILSVTLLISKDRPMSSI
ncbi:MAG TPA: ABC transporter permease [Firmicutes bacterium]|jgi:ABC-2 type transport system permease protein|nr:ABC transporter permease [Bacillota bacterium]